MQKNEDSNMLITQQLHIARCQGHLQLEACCAVCRLVQDHGESGIAWYAVGCYYLATGQADAARRFFGKATHLSPRHAPSWLAYGHAFAAQDESDQALAAYRTAARLFPGLHEPVLGMGREYQHMNNHMLAEQMLLQVCFGQPSE